MEDDQEAHWNRVYSEDPAFFGDEPSAFARRALRVFKTEGREDILELGCGHGRDTLFFARHGLRVRALDYARSCISEVEQKARELGLSESVRAVCHDLRRPLPLRDESFDACYSHMLFCMRFTTRELEFLFREVHRVLRPGGLNLYSVRNTKDKHYRKGTHRGEDMYEVEGFVVHFLSEEKVRHLASGYDIIGISETQEGDLPRELYEVALRKMP